MTAAPSSFLPEPVTLEVGRRFNWKVFGIILAGCMVGFVAVLPYTLTLQADALSKIALPIPLPLLLALQGVQNAVLFAVVGGLGYLLATRIGLGLPFIEGWLGGQPIWNKLPRIALIAVVGGLIFGGIIVALDAAYFGPAMNAIMKTSAPDVTVPNP